MRPIPLSLMLFLLGTIAVSTSPARNFRLGIDGGFSRSDQAFIDEWEDGFVVGTTLFFAPSDNIQIGIRGAFNRWDPLDGAFVTQLPGGVTGPEIDGSREIWEVVPAVRIATVISGSQVGLFGHFGAGLFVTQTDVTGEGVRLGAPVTQTIVEGTDNNWGLTLGLGVSLGRVAGLGLELLPLYHIIDPGDDPRQYFTVGGGISYEF